MAKDPNNSPDNLSELEKMQERFHLCVEGSADGLWDWDMKANEVWYSDRFKSLLGYQPDEFANTFETWASTLHPDDYQPTMDAIKAHTDEMRPYDVEYRCKLKIGEYKWFRARGNCLRDSNNKPYRMAGSLQLIDEEKRKKEELFAAKTQYKSLVQNIPGITYRCLLDKDWTMLYMSEQVEDITGYPAEAFISGDKTYTGSIHPDDVQLVDDAVNEAVNKKQSWEIEYRVIHKNGAVKWVYEKGQGVINANDEVAFLDGFILDITNQKELHLRQQIAVEGTHLGTWEWVVETNEVILNDNWYTMLGFEPDEIPATYQTWYNLLHPDDRERAVTHMKDFIEGKTAEYKIEYRLRSKLGGWIWIFSRAIITQRNAQDKPTVIIGTNQNITETKLALNEFQLIFDASPSALLLVDQNGTILKANLAAEKVFEYSKKELESMNVDALVPKDIRPKHPELRSQYLQNPRKRNLSANLILHAEQKSGKMIPVEISLDPIRSEDELLILTTIVDIREKKQYEQEIIEQSRRVEMASRAKSDFLANMSHEIRTPLNAILGFTDLLQQTKVDITQKDYLQTINESGKILLSIINDILDLSKIESQQLKFEQIDFNLEKAIEGTLKLTKTKIKNKPIEMTLYFDHSAPNQFIGDPTRLRQVLLNLIGNAAKFTEKGEIAVSVHAASAGSDLYDVKIAVKDTGVGIPQDKLDIIFENFQQADTSTTRKYGGTGLGLTISKKLIELMDGTISVESEVGKGSTFTVSLRLKKGKTLQTKVAPVAELKTKRIWILDDNATAKNILEQYIKDFGFHLENTFTDPQELLTTLKNTSKIPHLILSDILMPKMDGFELATRLRKEYPQVKLIAITSVVGPGTAEKAKKSGFDAYLSKPILRGELKHLIQVVFGVIKKPQQILTKYTYDEINLSGSHILIVEDNLVNQKLIHTLLKKLDCDISIANDGKEGLKMFQNGSYDLILMDLQMPNMGGIEAATQIRENLKSDIPIIALTAAVMKEDQEAAKKAGMNDFLKKPIDADKLKEVLLKYLQK